MEEEDNLDISLGVEEQTSETGPVAPTGSDQHTEPSPGNVPGDVE